MPIRRIGSLTEPDSRNQRDDLASVLEQRLCLLAKNRSGDSQGQGLELAIDQDDLELAFELADRLGDGRLGQAETFSGFGEISCFGHREKDLERAKIKRKQLSWRQHVFSQVGT